VLTLLSRNLTEIQQFCPHDIILPECSVQIANSEYYSKFRNSITIEKMKKKIRKKMLKIAGKIYFYLNFRNSL
jgi:hypothetical protein